MIKLHELIACCFLVLPAALKAQVSDTTTSNAAKLQWMEDQALWLRTDNAAGLPSVQIVQAGRTSLELKHTSGNYKRPQQPGSQNIGSFMSERYQATGNALFYGRFSFAKQQDKELSWTDVMNPYRGTPYIIADSVGGNWKKQLYGLELKAASGKLFDNRITLGAGISYNLSTGARQNDPRPLSTVNELTVTPGALWHISKKINIGFNGRYKMFKEEVGLTIRDVSTAQNIYKLTGVGVYQLPFATQSGETRNYKGNEYGGDLQLEVTGRNWKWFSYGGISFYSEDAQDNTTKPQEAGRFTKPSLNGTSTLQLTRSRFQHQFQLGGYYSSGKGREYLQTYNTVTLKYETIFTDIFSNYYSNTANVAYKITRLSGKNFYNWSLELKGSYNNLDNEYFYEQPSHQIITQLNFSIDGKKSWTIGMNQLIAGFKAGYTNSPDNSITFTGSTSGSVTNIVAREVQYPDHDYLIANGWNGALSLQYIFNVKPVQKADFFLSGDAGLSHRISSGFYNRSGEQRQNIRLAIGVIF